MSQSTNLSEDKQSRFCTRCEVFKPISEFYASHYLPGATGGSKCKACDRFMARRNYRANKQQINERNERNRLANLERVKENYRRREKDKNHEHAARTAVKVAVKTGTLLKKPCEVCGEPKVDFHHDKGYDKANWLTGKWLCRPHHAEAHVLMREAKLPEKDRLLSKKGISNG